MVTDIVVSLNMCMLIIIAWKLDKIYRYLKENNKELK